MQKHNNTLLLLLGLIVLVFLAVFVILPRMSKPMLEELYSRRARPSPTATTNFVPFTAQFLIFTNGQLRDFSASMYLNQSSAVYLEGDNATMINVNQSGITWDDFFKTLPFLVSADCLVTGTGQQFCSNQQSSLKFYLNGQPVSDLLTREMQPNDELLISYGARNDPTINVQLEQFVVERMPHM
ncbi:hypothetical protein C4579_03295 [Candidatus Microgenomates bacterium]|nr:MAG: hypothetical protein C4579_03295 [Candidatus Microgenomates bacterium]